MKLWCLCPAVAGCLRVAAIVSYNITNPAKVLRKLQSSHQSAEESVVGDVGLSSVSTRHKQFTIYILIIFHSTCSRCDLSVIMCRDLEQRVGIPMAIPSVSQHQCGLHCICLISNIPCDELTFNTFLDTPQILWDGI